MLKIKQILNRDWIKDSIAFKKNYHTLSRPAKNTYVRYQEDGYVYIFDVLLTKKLG